MTPARSVRSRYSGYRPRNALGSTGTAYDDGEAAAYNYLSTYGGDVLGAQAAGGGSFMPAPQNALAGMTSGAFGMMQGASDNAGPAGGTGFSIDELSDDQLQSYYGMQRGLVDFMNTPVGYAARGLSSVLAPGVSSLFGMMQGPILGAYQRELAKRGLMEQAFKEPASGEWDSYDAQGFDFGFYGYGDNALNAPGGRYEGQRTDVFGGNPATTGPAPGTVDFGLPDLGGVFGDDRGGRNRGGPDPGDYGGGGSFGGDGGFSGGGLY